jgi:hypothetical protein
LNAKLVKIPMKKTKNNSSEKKIQMKKKFQWKQMSIKKSNEKKKIK